MLRRRKHHDRDGRDPQQRRRTAVAALLWVSAITIMVLPTAEHEYTYRYVLPAVPLVCIAAAIALRKPGQEAAQT